MKINYKAIVHLLVIVSVFISCEKTANIETPEYSPKLVIHSYISPSDSFVKVHVSTTRNIYGKLLDYPKNLPAVTTLFDGEKEIILSPRDNGGFCSAKYQIEAGKEYRILVKCQGYPDVSAVSHVPALYNFSLSIDTISELRKYEWGTYIEQKATFKFTDLPGVKNYYSIYAISAEVRNGYTTSYPLYPINQDNEYNSNATKIISDNLIDGKPIITSYNFHFVNDINTTFAELSAYILDTDADYYKYHTSLMKYTGTDEPFTEFSPLYSNISGGYGIFASFVKYKKVLKLK